MGLLSRIGQQFKADMPLRQMGSSTLDGMAAGGAGGALAGGLVGAGLPNDMQGMVNPGTGLAAGMLGGAAMGGAGGLRHIVMTIARALKQQAPEMSDDAILQAAIKEAQKNYDEMGNMLLRKDGWR